MRILQKRLSYLRHRSCIKRFEQFVQRAIFDRQSCLREEEKESEEEIMTQFSKRRVQGLVTIYANFGLHRSKLQFP